jgi:trimethylamine--corrinoid protein Co-methyltransferase
MRSVNSIAYQTPQFSVLSESQIKAIHLAALEVLRRTGIRFHHVGAVDILKQAGAFVSDGNLIRFPASMVEDAISSVPGRVIMCDRNGEPAMFLEGGKASFGTGYY